jgi:hypothetical protein
MPKLSAYACMQLFLSLSFSDRQTGHANPLHWSERDGEKEREIERKRERERERE